MLTVIITALASLSLSAVAAYFAVVGLASTFPGAVVPVLIMGGVVEACKIVMVLAMHKLWHAKIGIIKYTNILLIILAMGLTSMGVFGFLSKANIQFSGEIKAAEQKIALIDFRIDAVETELESVSKQRILIEKSVDSLIEQEYAVGALRQLEAQREARENVLKKEAELREQILKLQAEKNETSQEFEAVNAEIGPVIYLAEILYGESEGDSLKSAVRIFIFALVILLDPFAVSLLITAQVAYNQHKKQKTENVEEPEMKVPPVDDGLRIPKSFMSDDGFRSTSFNFDEVFSDKISYNYDEVMNTNERYADVKGEDGIVAHDGEDIIFTQPESNAEVEDLQRSEIVDEIITIGEPESSFEVEDPQTEQVRKPPVPDIPDVKDSNDKPWIRSAPIDYSYSKKK